MNRFRDWVLIGLFFTSAIGTYAWLTSFAPRPGAIGQDAQGRLSEEDLVVLAFWLGGLLFLILVTLGVFATWYALSNRDLNRLIGGRFSTALWTGLLFVPLVQFVSLYAMAQHVHKAQVRTGVTGMHPVVLFLFMWLLLPVGIPLAQVQKQRIDWAGLEQHLRPVAPMTSKRPGWRVVGPAGGPGQAGAVVRGAQARQQVSAPAVEPVPSIRTRVRPEVVAMPASGMAAHFFAIASIPLGLFGPAGIAAGLVGLVARDRFLDLESRAPGHRGGRAVSRLHWPALVGMVLGSGVSTWMLLFLFAT